MLAKVVSCATLALGSNTESPAFKAWAAVGRGRSSGGQGRGVVGGTGGRQGVERVGGVGDVGAGNHLLLHPLDDAGQVSGVLS